MNCGIWMKSCGGIVETPSWIKLLRVNFLREHGAFGYNWLYLIQHPHVMPVEAYLRVKWFIQRGKRGWSDADGWSIFDYVSEWMPNAIRRLKENKIGTPMMMFPDGLDIENATNDELEVYHQKWLQILEDMAKGFDAVKAMDDELPYPGTDRFKELTEMRNRGLGLFITYFECLWD